MLPLSQAYERAGVFRKILDDFLKNEDRNYYISQAMR